MSISEARDQFLEWNRSSLTLRHHVNQKGDTYIRELVCYGPWVAQDDQFALLMLFVGELGMTLGNEDQSFLVKCSSWIGEGRHLDLLDAIPKSEFEPSGTDSPLVQKWPAPCPPNWIPEELTPDLSFLEDLAALLKASPGFGGSTPLQDAILSKIVESVIQLLQNMHELQENRNFLG